MAMADHFERHGVEVLRQLLDEDPDRGLRFLAKLVSKAELKRLGANPTDGDLTQIVARTVEGIRWKTPAEGKPAPDRLN